MKSLEQTHVFQRNLLAHDILTSLTAKHNAKTKTDKRET
jgi:hypothetical protein